MVQPVPLRATVAPLSSLRAGAQPQAAPAVTIVPVEAVWQVVPAAQGAPAVTVKQPSAPWLQVEWVAPPIVGQKSPAIGGVPHAVALLHLQVPVVASQVWFALQFSL